MSTISTATTYHHIIDIHLPSCVSSIVIEYIDKETFVPNENKKEQLPITFILLPIVLITLLGLIAFIMGYFL